MPFIKEEPVLKTDHVAKIEIDTNRIFGQRKLKTNLKK